MPDVTSTYDQARLVLNFGRRQHSTTRVALMLVRTRRGVPDVRLQLHWDGPAMGADPTVEDVLSMIDAFLNAHMVR